MWIYFDLPATTYYFYFGLFLLLAGFYVAANTCFSRQRYLLIQKIIYLTSCSVLILIACLHADNLHSYGPLVADTIHAIYQTSITEISGYVNQYVSAQAIIIAIFWVCLSVLTGVFLLPIPLSGNRHWSVLATGLIIGIAMVFFGKHDAANLITEASEYQKALSDFTGSRKQVLSKPEYANASSKFEGNIIVVLGESSTRHHFGIYNYVRNTTPLLDEIKHELNIFTDMISTHSHTIPSLSEALTFGGRESQKKTNELADIINVAKRAQFQTAWLSNQNAVGVWDNLVAAIGRQADVVKYHDPASGTQRERSVFDMELINSTKQLLTQNNHKRNLLFLHLMATHFPYCEIVPSDFAQDFVGYDNITMDYSVMGFHLMNMKKHRGMEGARQLMYAGDCYDRAVRYVDFTLRELIESLRSKTQPTLLIYISDHGEAPILGTGHESRMHSHFHVEIPFFTWANDAYKKQYSEKVQSIASNVDKPGSLVDFSYYLSDIAGISSIQNVEKRSIFSPGYEAFTRKTLHGKVGYDTFDEKADYSERTRGNLNAIKNKYGTQKFSKVWAHRVNTIGSMLESKELFSGIEMDLVFDIEKQQFFVYHPPAQNVGLNLQTHLRQDNGKTRYWFDWKNANAQNFKLALARLENLDKIYNLKDRIILESGTRNKSFSVFQKNGWHTSYYLPTNKILKCIKNCNESEKVALAKKLLNNRRHNGYDTVSFDYRLLDFFDTYLDKALEKNITQVYTWSHHTDISNKNAVEQLEKFINHPRIGVVLVNYPSPFDL